MFTILIALICRISIRLHCLPMPHHCVITLPFRAVSPSEQHHSTGAFLAAPRIIISPRRHAVSPSTKACAFRGCVDLPATPTMPFTPEPELEPEPEPEPQAEGPWR